MFLENQKKAYEARLLIKRNYKYLDSAYSLHMNRLKQWKHVGMSERIDCMYHATQIDSILLLDNGDVAVSGGPLNYEVLIYRNRINLKLDPLVS